MARKKKQAEIAPVIPDIRVMGKYQRPQNILIVGCGGTGAYVAGHLARLVSVLDKAEDKPWRGYRLILADGDKVERKNLERQHFVQRDLDTNKAEALAARYSAAFGMEVVAVPSYLENVHAITVLEPQLLIGCVDNNASRRIMGSWVFDIPYAPDRFWIDSGNEENSGQVVCGFSPAQSSARTFDPACEGEAFSLPLVTEVYPALLEAEDKFNSQLSCAELAQSAPQNMMANITAATIVLNFAQKILRGKALRAHGASFSVDNSFRTILNTPENLAKVNPKRRRVWEKPVDAQTI